MGRWLFCILLCVGFTGGCSKQDGASERNALTPGQSGDAMAPPSPRGPTSLAEAVTNSTVIQDTGDVNATVQQLTQELRDYVVRTRSVPKNFEEFASKSQVKFPPAPEGKQYAIAGETVVVVKR